MQLYQGAAVVDSTWRRLLAGICLVGLASTAAAQPAASKAPSAVVKGARNVLVAVFDWDRMLTERPLGSGVLVGRNRAITQCRIIADVPRPAVRQGRTIAQARLAHEDPKLDLCELEILPPASFEPLAIQAGTDSDLRPGDVVYMAAVANGSQVAMAQGTVGAISGAADRAIRISAKVSPGFAGGALLDRSGALLGVVIVERHRGRPEALAYATGQAEAPREDPSPSPAQEPAARSTASGNVASITKPALAEPPRALPQTTLDARAPDPQTIAYQDAMVRYLGDVVRVALDHAVYPPEARQAKWTGTSSIRFRLAPGGTLIESGVDRSSGYDTLDVMALLAVRAAIAELGAPGPIKERGMAGSVLITFQLPDR